MVAWLLALPLLYCLKEQYVFSVMILVKKFSSKNFFEGQSCITASFKILY